MWTFWGCTFLFYLWHIVKFLSQNRAQDFQPCSLWPTLWDLLLRHNPSRLSQPPKSKAEEESFRTSWSSATPNSLQFVGSQTLPLKLSEQQPSQSCCLLFSLSPLYLSPLRIESYPQALFQSGGGKVGGKTSSLLMLGIFPQRYSYFLCLRAFLLSPTLPKAPHLLSHMGQASETESQHLAVYPAQPQPSLRQWTQSGICLAQEGGKRQEGELEKTLYIGLSFKKYFPQGQIICIKSEPWRMLVDTFNKKGEDKEAKEHTKMKAISVTWTGGRLGCYGSSLWQMWLFLSSLPVVWSHLTWVSGSLPLASPPIRKEILESGLSQAFRDLGTLLRRCMASTCSRRRQAQTDPDLSGNRWPSMGVLESHEVAGTVLLMQKLCTNSKKITSVIKLTCSLLFLKFFLKSHIQKCAISNSVTDKETETSKMGIWELSSETLMLKPVLFH